VHITLFLSSTFSFLSNRKGVVCLGISLTAIWNSAYHKKKYHRLAERTEVVVFVQTAVAFYVHEKRHTEYGKYEHDQKQQETDIEQRRERHGQSEQERSDSLRSLH